jgi:hypothetical protein
MKCALAFLVASAIVVAACAAGRSAGYAAELEGCLQASPNCGQYVHCRKAVAERYSRPFDGGCVSDAGAE